MSENDFDLEETLDMLGRAPDVLSSLLRGSSAAWHTIHEGSGTWSAFDIVGHLVHAEETDWVPRARQILELGESQPFEPYDRNAQFERFADWTLSQLLQRFAEARRANLETVRAWKLEDEQLARTGKHPALGTVTLRQLLATWAVHDLGHYGQMTRVMAKRYTESVGPWRAYLSVLDR